MTVFSGPGFNLILYQSYFDSERVGSHLWLTLRRCSSRSKLTKETMTLYDIMEGFKERRSTENLQVAEIGICW